MNITMDYYARKFEKEIKLSLGVVARFCGKDKLVNQSIHFCRNSRLSRAWARCCYKYYDKTSSTIEFGDNFYAMDKRLVISTFVHEILHSIFRNCGHKGLWLKYANIISNNTDFIVTQYVTEEEKDIVDKNGGGKEYKYELYCDTCNKRIGQYARRINAFNHLSLCSCKTCGTNNLRYVQNY